jgi:cell division protein FtsL
MRTLQTINQGGFIQRSRIGKPHHRYEKSTVSFTMIIIISLAALIMGYIYLLTLTTQISMKSASSQKEFFDYRNQQMRLVQELAELKDPYRIRRLAMDQGMIVPNDSKLARVYASPWKLEVKPVSATMISVRNNGMNNKLSYWTKFLPFTGQAEARTSFHE